MMATLFDPDSLLCAADVNGADDDVPSGPEFAAWRLRILSRDEFAALGESTERLSPTQLGYLAWLNLLAPTSHNTVPQRLRIDPQDASLAIHIDPDLVLAESDPTSRQAHIGLGCGLANVVLGARVYGWATDVEVLASPPTGNKLRYPQVATVRFRRGAEPLDESWLRAMRARKVVRAEFDERVPLAPALVRALTAVVAQHAGLELHLITDAATRLFLGKFQELADTTVVNRDRFARELGAWLVEDDAAAPRGMRGREFGLSAEATRRMRQGLLRLGPLLPDEIAGFAKAGNLGMRTASAIAVITVDHDNIAQRVAAGCAYQEIALMLLQHGFATAMHAAITEVEGPGLALRGRLRTLRRPDVVFRIGRPLRTEDGRRPHSARPHLGDVLLPEGVR